MKYVYALCAVVCASLFACGGGLLIVECIDDASPCCNPPVDGGLDSPCGEPR